MFEGIAAIASWAGAATTAAEVASAASIIGEVGMGMSLVGVVTGDKDLTKIGAVIGGVVGIGELAYNTIGAGADLAGSAASSADTATPTSGLEAAKMDEANIMPGDTGTVPMPEAQMASLPNAGATPIINGGNMDDFGNSIIMGPGQGAAPAASMVAPAPTSATVASPGSTVGTVGDTSGVVNTPAGSTATPADTGINNDASRIAHSAADPTGAQQGTNSWLTNLLGGAGNDRTRATLIGALASIPSGIQAAQFNQAKLDLQKQQVAQTSHGSEVPRFSIIKGARV